MPSFKTAPLSIQTLDSTLHRIDLADAELAELYKESSVRRNNGLGAAFVVNVGDLIITAIITGDYPEYHVKVNKDYPGRPMCQRVDDNDQVALLRRLLKFYKHPLEFPGASELPDSACEHWLNWWEEGVALVEFEAAAEGSQDGGGEERLLVLDGAPKKGTFREALDDVVGFYGADPKVNPFHREYDPPTTSKSISQRTLTPAISSFALYRSIFDKHAPTFPPLGAFAEVAHQRAFEEAASGGKKKGKTRAITTSTSTTRSGSTSAQQALKDATRVSASERPFSPADDTTLLALHGEHEYDFEAIARRMDPSYRVADVEARLEELAPRPAMLPGTSQAAAIVHDQPPPSPFAGVRQSAPAPTRNSPTRPPSPNTASVPKRRRTTPHHVQSSLGGIPISAYQYSSSQCLPRSDEVPDTRATNLAPVPPGGHRPPMVATTTVRGVNFVTGGGWAEGRAT